MCNLKSASASWTASRLRTLLEGQAISLHNTATPPDGLHDAQVRYCPGDARIRFSQEYVIGELAFIEAVHVRRAPVRLVTVRPQRLSHTSFRSRPRHLQYTRSHRRLCARRASVLRPHARRTIQSSRTYPRRTGKPLPEAGPLRSSSETACRAETAPHGAQPDARSPPDYHELERLGFVPASARANAAAQVAHVPIARGVEVNACPRRPGPLRLCPVPDYQS